MIITLNIAICCSEKLGGVHKLRLQEEGVGAQKKMFCRLLHHRKCKQRGVGGQKEKSYKRSL